jgi:hypothetical protein
MSHSAVIHARIDASTKEATERILNSIGLTPTEAIRLFYRQIAMRGADSSGQRNRGWRGEDVIWGGIVEAFSRT